MEKYEGHRYFKMGVLYYDEQDYENAQEAFKNAIALNYNIEESQKYVRDINEKLTKKASEKLNQEKEKFEYHFKKALNYYFNDRFYEAMEHITHLFRHFSKK